MLDLFPYLSTVFLFLCEATACVYVPLQHPRALVIVYPGHIVFKSSMRTERTKGGNRRLIIISDEGRGDLTFLNEFSNGCSGQYTENASNALATTCLWSDQHEAVCGSIGGSIKFYFLVVAVTGTQSLDA